VPGVTTAHPPMILPDASPAPVDAGAESGWHALAPPPALTHEKPVGHGALSLQSEVQYVSSRIESTAQSPETQSSLVSHASPMSPVATGMQVPLASQRSSSAQSRLDVHSRLGSGGGVVPGSGEVLPPPGGSPGPTSQLPAPLASRRTHWRLPSETDSHDSFEPPQSASEAHARPQ
jgi:hypothetical protein